MKTVWLLEGHTHYDGNYVEAVFESKPQQETLEQTANLTPEQAEKLLEKGSVWFGGAYIAEWSLCERGLK